MKVRRFLLAMLFAGASAIVGLSAASAQGIEHFAVLSGGNEVSGAGAAAAGDPDAFGSASVVVLATSICYSIIVNNIATPTAAHIHEALAGHNAGIAIPLTPPATGTKGTFAGCVNVPDAALLQRLRYSPGKFYVNVHNGPFPGGAMRGQLD